MLRRVDFFLGVWSKNYEYKMISATRSQVKRGMHYTWCTGWRDFRRFYPIGVPTFDVRVRNSVRIQPISNEELVITSDSTAWRWCVAGPPPYVSPVFLHQSSFHLCSTLIYHRPLMCAIALITQHSITSSVAGFNSEPVLGRLRSNIFGWGV